MPLLTASCCSGLVRRRRLLPQRGCSHICTPSHHASPHHAVAYAPRAAQHDFCSQTLRSSGDMLVTTEQTSHGSTLSCMKLVRDRSSFLFSSASTASFSEFSSSVSLDKPASGDLLCNNSYSERGKALSSECKKARLPLRLLDFVVATLGE